MLIRVRPTVRTAVFEAAYGSSILSPGTMRKYGDKKYPHSKVEGHQHCGICMPEVKNTKNKARQKGKQDAQQAFLEFARKVGPVPVGMLAVGPDWRKYLKK